MSARHIHVGAWPYGARLAAAMLLGGVAAGVVGAVLSGLLVLVQRLSFGSSSPELLPAVMQAPLWRALLGPVLVAILAACGWYWLRRRGVLDIAVAVHQPGQLQLGRSFLDAVMQIAVVGAGASIGREGAPRQAAGATMDKLATMFALSRDDAGLLIAAAAGAGLAAVYNVPLAGAAFALEIIWRRSGWRDVLITVLISALATVTAWAVLGNQPTYLFPTTRFTLDQLLACLGIAILGAGLGWGFRELTNWAKQRRVWSSAWLLAALPLAMVTIAVIARGLPEVVGNGKDLVQCAFESSLPLSMWALLVVIKPLATALCLRCGMAGGLLTPAMATGAAAGAVLAQLCGTSVPIYALLGAAAVLAVGQNAPIFATLMLVELTRSPLWSMPLVAGVAFGAWALARALPSFSRATEHRESS